MNLLTAESYQHTYEEIIAYDSPHAPSGTSTMLVAKTRVQLSETIANLVCYLTQEQRRKTNLKQYLAFLG